MTNPPVIPPPLPHVIVADAGQSPANAHIQSFAA